MAEFPNEFSTSPVINAGSTASTLVTFTIVPRTIRLANLSSFDLYVDFTGNTPSTGTSHIIAANGSMLLNPVPFAISEIAMHTTTTAAAGARVSVLGLGMPGE